MATQHPASQDLADPIVAVEKIRGAISDILDSIDSDPLREGLQQTPFRVSHFLLDFLSPVEPQLTTFDSEGMDEMIIQINIPFYSFCEHHLVPFFGTGIIAYIPDQKIIGLSKLARVLDYFSRRFQNQERITMQVATLLMEKLQPKGVAVSLKARHLCMEMRGIRKAGTETITTFLTGAFRESEKTRNEFMHFVGG